MPTTRDTSAWLRSPDCREWHAPNSPLGRVGGHRDVPQRGRSSAKSAAEGRTARTLCSTPVACRTGGSSKANVLKFLDEGPLLAHSATSESQRARLDQYHLCYWTQSQLQSRQKRQRKRIAVLALENHTPTIVQNSAMVAAGCLMSYAPQRRELYRRSAAYVKKILAGVHFIVNVRSWSGQQRTPRSSHRPQSRRCGRSAPSGV